MNQAHFHLIVNHLPIIIPLIGLLVLIAGFVTKSAIVKRTAFSLFILGAVCTIPAFFSGEGAEEIVERVQGVDEKSMHSHEEAAEKFALLSYALGAISIVALWANWKKKSYANIAAIAVIVFSVVVLFFAKQTGTTGGEIRHTEIRTGVSTTNANATEKENANGEKKKDDDD